MGMNIRRVVTGHDAQGRSIVEIDEHPRNVVSSRPETSSCVLWTTEGFPVDNDGFSDSSGKPIGKTITDGTVFRVVRYEPGGQPRMHRTDSIDYAVVLSGRVEMILDEGRVILQAGDLVVQRGTMHGWYNPGPETCEIAFILVSATPVTAGGRTLHAQGG